MEIDDCRLFFLQTKSHLPFFIVIVFIKSTKKYFISSQRELDNTSFLEEWEDGFHAQSCMGCMAKDTTTLP